MSSNQAEEQPERKDFYLRYYVGHTGQFGHEFIEFEVRKDGVLRYANDSQYKRDRLIRKEVRLNTCVIDQFKKLIEESDILQADDASWPEPNQDGRQELEIVWGKEHIFFVVRPRVLSGGMYAQSALYKLIAFPISFLFSRHLKLVLCLSCTR